jgi:hypothetical protein
LLFAWIAVVSPEQAPQNTVAIAQQVITDKRIVDFIHQMYAVQQSFTGLNELNVGFVE